MKKKNDSLVDHSCELTRFGSETMTFPLIFLGVGSLIIYFEKER